MPDAGGFEEGAPGREDRLHGAAVGWGGAFAALPQEAPDAGGWQRVQARLPTQATRTRWPLCLVATAASLLLSVAVPVRMLPQEQPGTPVPAPRVSATPTPAASVAVAAPLAAPPSVASAAPAVSMPVASRDKPRRAAHGASSQRPARTIVRPVDATAIATAGAPASTNLEPLYSQSAQLESLLAMARDDRVASGTSAALSEDLDARVATIDAALIEPGLSDAQRSALWEQRVDALQQLVGIATTRRLYAARGQSYDAALVSID